MVAHQRNQENYLLHQPIGSGVCLCGDAQSRSRFCDEIRKQARHHEETSKQARILLMEQILAVPRPPVKKQIKTNKNQANPFPIFHVLPV